MLEARADALAGLGRVDEASVIYQQLATPARAKDKRLLEKRFYAYSDGERYGAAQGLLAGWQEPPTRWDFTGNMRMANDDYEKVLQLKTLLQAWRGQAGAAEQQLEAWLQTAPANPWLWLQLGGYPPLAGSSRRGRAGVSAGRALAACRSHRAGRARSPQRPARQGRLAGHAAGRAPPLAT